MPELFSAKSAYTASQSTRQKAVDKELAAAIQMIESAISRGEFHCITKCMSIQAKDALTNVGYEVNYNRDGNDGDTCTISWLNGDK